MKKILSSLLILALSATVLASCNKDEASSATSSTAATSGAESTTESQNAESDVSVDQYAHLRNSSFGGRDVLILVQDNGSASDRYRSIEIEPYETTSELIAEAVQTRNKIVEDLLDCKITVRRSNSTLTDIRSDILGVGSFDLVMPYMPTAATLAAEGAFYDMKSFDVIKLDQSYWDQNAQRDLSIANKVFFTTNDANLLAFDCTHAIVFNKTVAENNADVDDFYSLLSDGKWTYDALVRNAKLVTAESDGVDGMTWRDTWGFFVNTNYATTLFVGAGEKLTSKDSEDLPILSAGTERAASVVQKIVDIFSDTTVSINIENYASALGGEYTDVYTAATASFAENRALFRSLAIVDLQELQNYDNVNYGILPTPKFDEDQDNYYNIVSAVLSSCFAIPVNAPDAELSAALVEALALTSTDTVRRNYYEVLLKGRQIADTEGEEALDLIFNNLVYEAGTIYTWGTLNSLIYTVATSGTNTFASSLDTIRDSVNAAIQQTIDSYENQ